MNKYIGYIFVLELILTFCSCSEQTDINGIWIGNYPKRSTFESSSNNHILYSPKLLDLTDNKTAIIKFFNEAPTEINWSLSGDILTLNSKPYRIVSLTKDSIVFSSNLTPQENVIEEVDAVDTWDGDSTIIAYEIIPEKDDLYYLTRINETKVSNSPEDISNQIKNKIWRNSNLSIDSLDNLDWIEFLNNGVALYNINFSNESQNYIQNECWGVEKYKGFAFLLFYKDWYRRNGEWDFVYQLTNLRENEIIFDTYKRKNNRFISKPAAKDYGNTFKSKFQGKWISLNDTNSYYGITPEYSIKNGNMQRYRDTLIFEFMGDSLFVNIKNIETSKFKWKLNANNSILITEEKLEFDSIVSFHIDYFSIKDVTEKSFDLEIFDNYRETGKRKPNQIVLNKFQKFKKIN